MYQFVLDLISNLESDFVKRFWHVKENTSYFPIITREIFKEFKDLTSDL